jgi:hypothetical protein
VSKPWGRALITGSAPIALAAASTSALVASGRPKRILSATVARSLLKLENRKLRWCTERRRLVVEFWLALANAAIVCGRLLRRAWSCYRWQTRPRRRP